MLEPLAEFGNLHLHLHLAQHCVLQFFSKSGAYTRVRRSYIQAKVNDIVALFDHYRRNNELHDQKSSWARAYLNG